MGLIWQIKISRIITFLFVVNKMAEVFLKNRKFCSVLRTCTLISPYLRGLSLSLCLSLSHTHTHTHTHTHAHMQPHTPLQLTQTHPVSHRPFSFLSLSLSLAARMQGSKESRSASKPSFRKLEELKHQKWPFSSLMSHSELLNLIELHHFQWLSHEQNNNSLF